MRHQAVRLSSPTAFRSRCRPANPVRPPGAAISAAGRAARMPAGAPSASIAAASGDLVFGCEERIR
jgi:hypothetical protein